MAEYHWDRLSEEDRIEFARYLQPLVTASRTKNFTRAEASVYLLTLRDVPKDVLAAGVTSLLEHGITWMPKPGDIKVACADVVKARRSIAARQAQAFIDDCPTCDGSGWNEVEINGETRATRCLCWKRGHELKEQAGQPIALPPARELEGDEA